MFELRFLLQAKKHLDRCGFPTQICPRIVLFLYSGKHGQIISGSIASEHDFMTYVEEEIIPPPLTVGEFPELDEVMRRNIRWRGWLGNEQWARYIPEGTQQLLDECYLLMMAFGWTPPQDRYSAMREMIDACLTGDSQMRLREAVGQHM